jgi:hypothetical protein
VKYPGFCGQVVFELSYVHFKTLAHLPFTHTRPPAISLFFRQKLPLLGFSLNAGVLLRTNNSLIFIDLIVLAQALRIE